MKKIIIPMMAVAALAACTKSEVQYETAGEIAFAPVAKNVTKSVAGYNGETFDGAFPTAVNLYVFANASNDAGTAWDAPYFKNAKFVYNESKDVNTAVKGAYAGDPTRYWPNVKTLKFAGYSDACGVEKNATMDFANDELTIPAYTQDNANYTTEGANDLMWFSRTEAYSKQATEIAAQMKHACSWITIKVAVAENIKDNGYKLNKLEVLNLIHEGSVTCSKSAKWKFEESPEKTPETYYENKDGKELTTSYVKYEPEGIINNFIVLPQSPDKLNVTYTYVSQDNPEGVADLTLTETAPVSLALADNTEWLPGVHYIYNVLITATEILIDPKVVTWTESVYDADKDKDGNQPIEIK